MHRIRLAPLRTRVAVLPSISLDAALHNATSRFLRTQPSAPLTAPATPKMPGHGAPTASKAAKPAPAPAPRQPRLSAEERKRIAAEVQAELAAEAAGKRQAEIANIWDRAIAKATPAPTSKPKSAMDEIVSGIRKLNANR